MSTGLVLPDADSNPNPASQPKKVKAAGFRTDIQALRAVAVMAVVLNHLWPVRLTGGYVGVDIFFVISGFLITSHLGKELAESGRVRLGRFYARRIRRLLPAAFLVLAFVLVAAYFLLPYPRWGDTAQHVIASALYGENWLLASESVNYMAHDAAPSLVQHYWSLSVEEQFYLFWPLLLMLLGRGRRVGVVVVGLASLAFCITLTGPSAYFVTPARVWEFGLGALIALAGARFALPGIASLAGFAMIIGAAVLYTDTTPFPGYMALIPTVGTALVIIAGNRGGRQWHTPVTAAWPVRWVGDISYSLYLWHWPLILLAPFALGETLTTPVKVGVLAVSLLLAAATKRLVEDPGRTWRVLAGSTKLTFAAMVAGLMVLTAASFGLNLGYDRQVAQAERDMASPTAPCNGAGAIAGDCTDPYGPARNVAMGPANEYFKMPKNCHQLSDYKAGDTPTTNVCDFSGGAPDPEVVWLVGDSHAVHWQGPLFDLARERKWVFKSATLGGCPFAKVAFTGYRGPVEPAVRDTCTNWTSSMADVIAADHPAKVFTAFFSRMETVDDGSGRPPAEQYRAGLQPYWQEWTAAGARVVVLADPPLNGDVRSPDCVTLHPSDPLACAVPRPVAQPPDPLVEAARTDPAVSVVDLTEYFCDRSRCYAVVGGVSVYFDANHMNLEFARSLKPMLAKAIDGR
jgi:peptidoglycan/LPS O-acetylase OafA/YrhL